MSGFSEQLRQAMEQAQVSQVQLCRLIGVGKSSVSQYVSGKVVPSKERITAIANALGVEESFLTTHEQVVAEAVTEFTPGQTPTVRTPHKITPMQAGRCMRINPQAVRKGLVDQTLPFGYALKGSGKSYTYFINPDKFRACVGETLFCSYFGRTVGKAEEHVPAEMHQGLSQTATGQASTQKNNT